MKKIRPLIAAILALPLIASAQTATLAPQAERIDDETIERDHTRYEAVQARIKALNDGGRRVADYHLAKAQCWLDASFHEYTRNDRSAFPQAAMSESDKLVTAIEQRAEPLPSETPLANGAAKLRPDLWERIHVLKQGPGFSCAAQRTACAEVELVHAGNEFNQQGWRHAKPYVQIAEDGLAESEAQAGACAPQRQVAATEPAPAPIQSAPRSEEPLLRRAEVVFAFDRFDRYSIARASIRSVDALLRQLDADQMQVMLVRLVGHADRLNHTADERYNQRLSARRAQTVRALLIGHGIPAQMITTAAEGDSAPVERCEAGHRTKVALEACLQPNRRVVIDVTARRRH